MSIKPQPTYEEIEEFYHSDAWKIRKKRIIKRRGNYCECCGAKRTAIKAGGVMLRLCHRTKSPGVMPYPDRLADKHFVILCQWCHGDRRLGRSAEELASYPKLTLEQVEKRSADLLEARKRNKARYSIPIDRPITDSEKAFGLSLTGIAERAKNWAYNVARNLSGSDGVKCEAEIGS